MASQAIKFVHATKSSLAYVQLKCQVKPGASKQREGIISLSESAIDLCVSAPARDGEANQAVRMVVSKVLKVPKSDVQVIQGTKSREKTIAVTNTGADERSALDRVRQYIQAAATGGEQFPQQT